jgi:hypothetical protein
MLDVIRGSAAIVAAECVRCWAVFIPAREFSRIALPTPLAPQRKIRPVSKENPDFLQAFRRSGGYLGAPCRPGFFPGLRSVHRKMVVEPRGDERKSIVDRPTKIIRSRFPRHISQRFDVLALDLFKLLLLVAAVILLIMFASN